MNKFPSKPLSFRRASEARQEEPAVRVQRHNSCGDSRLGCQRSAATPPCGTDTPSVAFDSDVDLGLDLEFDVDLAFDFDLALNSAPCHSDARAQRDRRNLLSACSAHNSCGDSRLGCRAERSDAPTHRKIPPIKFGDHSIPSVILSGEIASRSEAISQSKDPYPSTTPRFHEEFQPLPLRKSSSHARSSAVTSKHTCHAFIRRLFATKAERIYR
jgi:hypothetical protein